MDVKNIKLKYSGEGTPNKIIYELMKVEEDAYAPKYRGEYESICSRFQKYKEMFILAYDSDKIIGYLCFFPISKRLHDVLLTQKGLHDDDIKAIDVVKMTEHSYIYLLSIALCKHYQGIGLGKKMMDAFFVKMREEQKKGNRIEDIIASVVTEEGEQMMKQYGFKLIKDYLESAHYKLYKREGKKL